MLHFFKSRNSSTTTTTLNNNTTSTIMATAAYKDAPTESSGSVADSNRSVFQDSSKPTTVTTVAVNKPESALKSFLSGGVGGICVVLVGHPLDLIKVRMQTSGTATTQHPSVMGMFANTFRTQGIRGLYRGVSAPLTAVTPMFAVSFWGYDIGQRMVSAATGHHTLNLTEKCIAGGISAFPTTVLMAPSERIKCILQTSTVHKSMVDCGWALYKQGGIASVYKGTALTLARDVPGSIAWFGVYEYVKLVLMRAQGMEDPKALSPAAVLTAGGLAGMACWIVSIPADVLKSRYQAAPEGTFSSSMDVLKQLLQKEGPSALFTGIKPALIRAFPANAACFFGMEVARKCLSFMD